MIYSCKCCIGGCEETQACPTEEVLTSLFIIFLQRTFLAFSHSIRLTNIGLANTGLANTGLSAVAWERTPIPGRAPITTRFAIYVQKESRGSTSYSVPAECYCRQQLKAQLIISPLATTFSRYVHGSPLCLAGVSILRH